MRFPLQMTVRGSENSEALKGAVQKRAQKMEKFSHSITGGRITFQIDDATADGKHCCDVMLSLSLPGERLVMHHRSRRNDGNCAYCAINEIFHLAERSLRRHEQRRRFAVRNSGIVQAPRDLEKAS